MTYIKQIRGDKMIILENRKPSKLYHDQIFEKEFLFKFLDKHFKVYLIHWDNNNTKNTRDKL